MHCVYCLHEIIDKSSEHSETVRKLAAAMQFMCLKGLVTSTFWSSEPFYMLRLIKIFNQPFPVPKAGHSVSYSYNLYVMSGVSEPSLHRESTDSLIHVY